MVINKNLIDSFYEACELGDWESAKEAHADAVKQIESALVYVELGIERDKNVALLDRVAKLEAMLETEKNETVETA